jgi:ureidoglycolate dehydrogenase (NAD+)
MESENRILHDELIKWTRKLLKKAGFDNEQADRFAEALIWSDLVGRSNHGVWRLPTYLARLEAKLIKCPCRPTLCPDRQALAVMDGDQGLGHFVGHEAMRCAIGKAETFGIGAVGVHNSNHFGTGAYFVHLAAEQNMIGLAFSNSFAKVAAHGGIRPVFGTNPFAFGAPGRDGKHILLDMSTSMVSGSQMMKFTAAGLPLPEGIAVDEQGSPVTSAHELDKATLLPFGGAKGYGIALMIEILTSVLTGAMFSKNVNSMFKDFSCSGKNGHFFLAIDLGQMINPEVFSERLELLFKMIRGSGNAEGDVLIPGETRWARYQDNLKRGIPLDLSTLSGLEKLSVRYGIPPLAHVRSASSAGLI